MRDIEWLKEQVEKDIHHVFAEGDIYYVSREHILGLIDQLDTPELPEIPDYVADWIEGQYGLRLKDDKGWVMFDLMVRYYEQRMPKKVSKYAGNELERLAHAILFGYTVEEKKYYIKIGPTRYARKYLEDRIDNQLAMFEKDAGVFTEKEILKLENGDKLWAFAKEVTE